MPWYFSPEDRASLRRAVVELSKPNPLLQDAPYAEMPKAEDFVGLNAVLPKLVEKKRKSKRPRPYRVRS